MEHSPPLGQPPRILLSGGGGPQRFKLSPFEMITLGAIMLVAAYVGYQAYARATDLNKAAPVANTYLPSFRTTLTSTVSSTGTVAATQQVSLNFDIGQGTGKILKFFVGLGDKVTAGQPLAKLDDSDLQKTLQSAQSNLSGAQSRLDAVLHPTASTIAQSDQTIAQTTSNVTTAQNALDKLKNPIPSDIATAQQAVAAADASVQQAQQNIATAQAQLQQAQADSNTAGVSASTAFNTLQTAYNGASVACAQYGLVPLAPQMGQLAAPAPSLPYNLLSAQQTQTNAQGTLVPSQPSATNSVASACSTALGTYNNAVSPYNTAVATAQKADATVRTQSQALNSGQLQSAVNSAILQQNSANTKLNALMNPSAADLNAAQATLDSAKAANASAKTARDTLNNPTPDQVLPLQATVDQAAANVSTAQKNLDAATITAPFDGTISQVNGDVGTLVTANTTVFILLNPNLIRIDANVDQVDINNLKTGQTATVTFDALQGRSYTATITAIGLTPTIQQGVVTYNVTLSVDTTRLAPGTPVPAPGMTAAISVLTSRTENALVVPNRAIRRLGARATVTVKSASGQDETRQVTTGATNGTLTQITSGLNDGEEVLISAASTARSTTALPGGIQVPAGR